MSQAPPPTGGFSPPWFLIIGLVAGAAFLGLMLSDNAGKGGHSKHVIELTSENWQKEVVESATPILVDFWGPNCPPCRQLAPIIDKLADRFAGKFKVGKVNVAQQNELANKYGIQGIPCVMFFNGNENPSQTLPGLRSEGEYVSTIQDMLARK